MSQIIDTANATYPDGPSSSPSEPTKASIRALFGVIDGALTSVVDGMVIGGAVVYSTRALLYADLAHAAGKLGVVYNDSTAAYNGVYVKSGSSGSGSWAITNLALPSTFAADLAGKLDNTMSTARVLGRLTAGTGAVEELTGANIRSLAAVFSAAEISSASRVSSLVTLINTSGSGQNVTAEIPAELLSAGYALTTRANLRVSWPSANTGADPTLTVADSAGTYTITLKGPAGRTIQAGELKAAGRYTVQFIANVGFAATGMIVEPLAAADIAGIDDYAAVADVVSLDQAVYGQQIERPGDAPAAWSSQVAGLPVDRPALSSPVIVSTTEGRVVRLSGAGAMAPRAMYRLDSARQYEVRLSYRRPQNVADPAGASVRLVMSWLNAAGGSIGETIIATETPTVSMGRRTVTRVLGANVTGDVDFAWPSGAIYGTPFIETYQAESVTDVEAIHWTDITDIGGYSPDLTALTATVDGIVSEDLPDRTAALEVAVTAPKVSRYETRAEAAAATVAATTEVVEVQRYALDAPVSTAHYTRDVSASTGGFQSADGAYWSLADPVTRLEMFGAVGDGAADDEAAWAAAKTIGRPIWLDRDYLVTDPSNTLGIPLLGPGKIITAVTGGFVQQNSNRDNGPVHFRSHLWRAKDLAMAGTPLKVVIMGDSTATNSYGINLQTFVADELRNMGVAVSEVLSEAVSGHSWSSQNLGTVLTGLGNQKQLALIKFGTNDAGGSGTSLQSALTTMRNAMRQRLGEIRASTYGGYAELSILLIMPSALGNNADNANNRNNLWLEMIKGCYVEAAKDFQCGLYDPYQESRNAVDGEGRWLDSFGVHAEENYSDDIWGRALRETMALHGGYQRNRFVNQAADEGVAPAASSPLSDYPIGESWLRPLVADGWPFGGVLRTERHVDAVAKQTLYTFSQGHSQAKTRNWFTSSNIWSTWSGEAAALTLQNSWVAYGGTLGTPSVRRSSEGLVSLTGVMKNGTTTNGTLLFTLPVGYRPTEEKYVTGIRYAADVTTQDVCLLRIQTTGEVSIARNANADFLGLDGVTFWTSS